MSSEEEKQGLWKIYSILMGVMIGGSVLIIGGQAAWKAIQENASRSVAEGKPSSINSLPLSNSPITSAPTPLREEKLVQPSSKPNPFDKVIFPLSTCGDSMPTDPKDYPLNFYPVFIDSTKNNLQLVKSRFCQDAYQMVREATEKEAIQVASFTSMDRAEAFKNFMIRNFGNAEIGQPRKIEFKQ